MSTKSSLSAISLFSGAMGLDLGLEKAGFKVKVAVENNSSAVATIHSNKPRLPVISRDISTVKTAEILERGHLVRGQATLISAGPCCQSFSTVGKRHSIGDPRGSLFFDFCRIVKEAQPRFFVMENVKGMLSSAVKHRPLNLRGAGFPALGKNEEFGSALKLILHELRKLNYYVLYSLLNTADYGVPQNRWRVIFIGSRDGEQIQIPAPSHCDPLHVQRTGLLPWVTLRQAVKGVRATQWPTFSDDRMQLLRRLTAGQNWRDLPESLHRKALGAAADSWGGRAGFCRRLAWDEPAPTLTTAPDGRATTLCHPELLRPLAIEEYKALQQFPIEWNFEGSLRQRYMQVGNAVPIGLGIAIGRSLRATIRAAEKTAPSKTQQARLGTVECADKALEARLQKRKKTQLHPRRLRTNPDPKAARKWLAATAS